MGGVIWLAVDICIKNKGLKQFLLDLSLYSFWKNGQKLFWYVAFILAIYAIYPLIYKSAYEFREGRYRFLVIFIWMASDLIMNAYCKCIYPEVYKNIEIALCRVPVFLCGCLAGGYVYNNKNFCHSMYVMAFILSMSSIYICKSGGFPALGQRYTYVFLGIANCLTLSVLFSWIDSKMKAPCRLLGFLGRISFELYIVHVALICMFKKSIWYTENCFDTYCILMLITVGIAALLNYVSGLLSRALSRVIE